MGTLQRAKGASNKTQTGSLWVTPEDPRWHLHHGGWVDACRGLRFALAKGFLVCWESCEHVPVLYLVLLGSFFGGEHGVEAVSLGPVAHHADGLLVLLAEELQSLLVLLAPTLVPRCSSACLQAQLLGDFGDLGQLPAGTETFVRSRLPALGAGEVGLQPFPAAGDAFPAEVVAAGDGDGLLEIAQADGAGGFALQALQGALRSHGSASGSGSPLCRKGPLPLSAGGVLSGKSVPNPKHHQTGEGGWRGQAHAGFPPRLPAVLAQCLPQPDEAWRRGGWRAGHWDGLEKWLKTPKIWGSRGVTVNKRWDHAAKVLNPQGAALAKWWGEGRL